MSADGTEHIVNDYIKEARASLDRYYEDHDPFDPAKPSVRLLESIAASLVSIARSLEDRKNH